MNPETLRKAKILEAEINQLERLTNVPRDVEKIPEFSMNKGTNYSAIIPNYLNPVLFKLFRAELAQKKKELEAL